MNVENRRGLLRTTAIAVIAVTLLTLIALFIPVRHALIREIDQRFELEAQLVYSTISSYLDHSVELASQIPSRTQVRQEMLRYVWGEVSQEEYRQFAEPRLEDAVNAAGRVVTVTRIDRNRIPVAIVGDPIPVPESLGFHPSLGEIVGPVVRTNSTSVFVIMAPIRDPVGGLLGYDLVGISLESLRQELSRATRLFNATTATISAEGETIAIAGGSGGTESDRLATVDYRVTSHWNLTVTRPVKILYAPAYAFLTRIAIITIVLAVAMLLVIHRSLRAVNERTRTKELERDIANRQLLLREVHHRVKNDLSIVGSLLSLQRSNSSEQAVQAALSEAEHRVSVVSGIYDELYRTEDFGSVRIREVLEGFMKQFHDVTISLYVDDIVLDRTVASPVGIIVNELVVNAVKYGKPSSGEAEISVELARREAGALRIAVRDNGPGFPSHDPHELSGFGLSMVETLGSQFDGELTIPKTEVGGAIEIVLHGIEGSSQ